jgi:GNAT superfamily N-acetyltransferase
MCPVEGVVVRPLALTDERSSFHSSNIDLDRFFQRYAGQNQFRHHIGTTWVAARGESVLGFATLSAAHLELGDLPEDTRRGLPTYPLPELRLARLAVAIEARGLGIGRVLLRAVFDLAWRMSEEFGCIGMLVDAKPDALDFYSAFGSRTLQTTKGALGDRPQPSTMFLELKAIPRPR